VSQEHARRGAGISDEATAGLPPDLESPLSLTVEEKSVLQTLVGCGSARTVAQLCASSGLDRGQVTGTLESLRAKCLVTRFNTLVESYAARFPGVEV
jgi:DNA-binding MarR family transcriptional regulator